MALQRNGFASHRSVVVFGFSFFAVVFGVNRPPVGEGMAGVRHGARALSRQIEKNFGVAFQLAVIIPSGTNMDTLEILRPPPSKSVGMRLPLDVIATLKTLAEHHQTSRARVLAALVHDAGKRLLPKRKRSANNV